VLDLARGAVLNVRHLRWTAVTALPRSALLACWFSAWTRGSCSLDDARDAVVAGDAAHDVLGLDVQPVPLVIALGRLRALGAGRATLALPVPGDPVGLAGPPAFNEIALDAGEAVLLPGAGLGLVPTVVGAGVTWAVEPATAVRTVPDVAEADQSLRELLLESSARLADLDVAHWRPEATAGLQALRAVADAPPLPGLPPRTQRLAVLAVRCAEIAELGLEDDGGAISAFEAAERRDALLRLARGARHALVAACSG